jgi:hypothetical protein
MTTTLKLTADRLWILMHGDKPSEHKNKLNPQASGPCPLSDVPAVLSWTETGAGTGTGTGTGWAVLLVLLLMFACPASSLNLDGTIRVENEQQINAPKTFAGGENFGASCAIVYDSGASTRYTIFGSPDDDAFGPETGMYLPTLPLSHTTPLYNTIQCKAKQ